jgi:glycosyltransferase involved in cell wall biosynthesis
LNILHVIPSISMKDGGSSAALRAIAAGSARAGAEVVVATTDDDGDARLPYSSIPDSPGGNPQYHVFPKRARSHWKYSRALAHWVRQNTTGFDVVHVHGMFSHATLPAVRAARAARVPYIITTNGTLEDWSLAQHAARKRLYLSLFGRTIFSHAASIHVTSEAEAIAVRRHWPQVPVAVVPLAADAPPKRFVRLDARAADALEVVFLGRLHPKKGVPMLLDAVARAADQIPIHLTLAGDGPAVYRNQLEAQARALDLADRVSFVGHVDGDRRWQLLADADVFALPSAHENFGIAAAEALSCGTPVLLSPDVALAEAAAAAGAGRVVERTANAFARALVDMARDPALRTDMRVRAHQLARDQFSWERTVDQLIGLYRAAVDGRQ